jgi:proline racemase
MMKFNRIFSVIDSHTGGNAERVVISGVPPIPGKTMLEKLKYVRDHLDFLRTLLVHEPRGHSNMFASLLTPPTLEGAHFGVIYLEPGGCRMCGHGTIAVCTVLVETGMVSQRTYDGDYSGYLRQVSGESAGGVKGRGGRVRDPPERAFLSL